MTKSLSELVHELDKHHVDMLHIDCNDNLDVFADIEQIKTITNTPIDLHIISNTPQKFIPYIEKTKPDFVSFQFENLPSNFIIPTISGVSFGLALISETPASQFASYSSVCDFVLIMTTTPGKSGGTFNKQNFKKIREFKFQFPTKRIEVDGGVNAEVSFILRNMGVDTAVVGSYLFKEEFLGTALLNLKNNEIASHFLLSDFMIDITELPCLNKQQLSLEAILQTIEKYKLGFVLITDNEQNLVGLISNADVRKTLLKNIHQLSTVNPYEFINTKPLVIQQHATISELFQLIKSVSFPVIYIPILTEEKKLVGALTFNNLIKGES